jgi:two-component sensor histidine kinase
LGHIEITTTISADGTLFTLEWIELNGPDVQQPTRRSFGSKLIEDVFMGRLKGKALLSYLPAGVVYRLEAPVAALLPEQMPPPVHLA